MFRNPTADLLVVLLIVLLILGPKRLPGLGKSIGHGIREFKDGITGKSTVDDEDRPQLTAASATPPAVTTDRDAAEVASPERRS
jgi:sec-independent protein translocase protein TatA